MGIVRIRHHPDYLPITPGDVVCRPLPHWLGVGAADELEGGAGRLGEEVVTEGGDGHPGVTGEHADEADGD